MVPFREILTSRVINCAFDQLFYAKSENDCLLLVYSFSPRVQSIPRGPRETPQNDIKCVARNSIKKDCKIYNFFLINPFSIAYEVLCHCETPLSGVVAISRKGYLIRGFAKNSKYRFLYSKNAEI